MASSLCVIALVFALLTSSTAGVPLSAASVPEEKAGYISPSKDAHLFYWFMRSYVSDPSRAPLVLWLQGGPGGSSTGFGNFLEVGPLDVNGNKRDHTWLHNVNLLFVDQPVGTGYSYVDDNSAYTTNEDEIARDMVALLAGVEKEVPGVLSMPFYIFSESYGGKMASNIGVAVAEAIAAGHLHLQFRGVALGDSWVDPISCVQSYGDFLYINAQVDEEQKKGLDSYAEKMDSLIQANKGVEATNQWGAQQQYMENVTGGVNVYNFLQHGAHPNEAVTMLSDPHPLFRGLKADPESELPKLMNSDAMRKKLGIPDSVVWGEHANDVFSYLSNDFMHTAVPAVDTLLTTSTSSLNSAGVEVNVYVGALDLIVTTPSVDNWLKKLKWAGLDSYEQSERELIFVGDTPATNTTAAYVKSYDNLAVYYILNAGHMVPADQPATAFEMMRRITHTAPYEG